MTTLKILGIALLLLVIGGGGFLYWSYTRAMAAAQARWSAVLARAAPADARFDPAMVAGLPEVPRRYFTHAIAPGTPLKTTVTLEMRGTFLLGDVRKFQAYEMEARQILTPPDAFVWIPSMRSGVVHITGSDALVSGEAWMRFWINGLIPVANVGSSPDVVRSARFRSAVEAIWAPAALLPREGISWEQVGADTARVTIATGRDPIVLEMTLDAAGGVRQVVGQRWSNTNSENSFRLQPFGGTIEAEQSFGGYTIPSRVKVGNHFGTAEYLPFFQAEIIEAAYP